MTNQQQQISAGYKQTDIGIIPNDWEVKKLGDVCTMYSGGTPLTSVKSYYGGDIPWITSTDLNKAFINSVDGRITKLGLEKSSAKMIEKRTLLLALYGATAGVVGFSNIKAAINQAVLAIKPKNDNSLYLYFYFKYRKSWITKTFTQGGQPNLSSEIIKSIVFPFPTNTEQKAIAQALSDIDSLITKLSQLIQKKRHIKQGAMQELLTGKRRLPGFSGEWKITELGRVADITMGQSPLSKYYNKAGIGVPLIQGNADINNRKTIKRVFTTNITRKGKAGDIIMSVRAPVGEIAKTYFDVCLGRGVCSIRFVNNYLYHAMIAHEPTWKKLSSGSTFDSVTSNDVKSFEIYLPKDEKEQTAISQTLSDMDAEIETLEKQKAKYINLKHGMMQQLLTGKIRLIKD
jgi:type I restriction enzyme S subunit